MCSARRLNKSYLKASRSVQLTKIDSDEHSPFHFRSILACLWHPDHCNRSLSSNCLDETERHSQHAHHQHFTSTHLLPPIWPPAAGLSLMNFCFCWNFSKSSPPPVVSGVCLAEASKWLRIKSEKNEEKETVLVIFLCFLDLRLTQRHAQHRWPD